MNTLDLLHDSKAMFSIVSVLTESKSALSFREITRRAKVGIRSAQLAITKLLKNEIVSRENYKNRALYKIMTTSPELEELKLFIDFRRKKLLAETAASYSKNAKNILETTSSLTNYALNLRRLNPK